MDFATAVAGNLVSKLSEYLIAPIGRQCGYVLFYKNYTEDLKKSVEELQIARERVQLSVDEALYNGKSIFDNVKVWLDSAKEEAEIAENLLKHSQSAKDGCFRGWLLNPMVRYPIGRKMKKIIQVIQALRHETQLYSFGKVYYENPPITSAARSDDKEYVLESRTSIIEDVLKAIADDNVHVIGVYGPGGVGKSKLLNDVVRIVRESLLVDVIAAANVSRNSDLKRIQGEIAHALGLKLMNVETARGRASCLRARLQSDSQKKILIILDDIWNKIELEEVGIPCGDDNKVRGCKLLLTSRYRHVLQIDMCSDRTFQLKELEHGEARRLFERTVGDRVNDPEFENLMDRVVKNCGGLPLLIMSMAKRLRRGDLAEWRAASANIELSHINSIVELNYNDLKDERIRLLFLVCALSSGKILIRDYLIYCMGLGLYEKFCKTMEAARDRLIMDFQHLQDSSLLLGSDDMKQFTMHDLYVNAAVSLASEEWNALVGKEDYGFKQWSEEELRKCSAIAFPFVGIKELPEKLGCPNLRMLLLFEHNPSLKIPESFFESMKNLQVLHFIGLSFPSLPPSIEVLENLKSLCLDHCHLEDVTVLGKLKGLQFLSLFASSIACLPKEIGELKELRFLDLRQCVRLKVIEPDVLGSLVNLEELYMEHSFDNWEAEDKAPRTNVSLAELKKLKMLKLSTLDIAIPHSLNFS